MKKVLITGSGSYIGTSFINWVKENHPGEFETEELDMIDSSWRKKDFSGYDAVFHVAGLAHADVGKVSAETKAFYYKINRDLAIETAEKAKRDGVKQFVFMSSMIIYGESAGVGKRKVITRETRPHPANFYGDSKWQADKGIRKLQDATFHVAVIRPPMIYGKGSKGNYQLLAKLAKRLPIFPDIENERSMLHIDNLCEFLTLLIESGMGGIYFPQNREYVRTSQMVKMIGEVSAHKVRLTKALNPGVVLAGKIPGKVSGLANKAFGNMVYEKEMSRSFEGRYQIEDLTKSIMSTENSIKKRSELKEKVEEYSVLMSVYYKDSPEYLRESIESMLAQTVPCSQFVIVEDGPLGVELNKVIDQYAMLDKFTIVKNERNLGLGKALDEGLKYCKYDLVARMDADDISKKERCEKLLRLFRDKPQLAIAGTNIDEFYDNPNNIVSRRIVPSDYEKICKFMRRRSPFNHPTVMFRKSEVLRCGGYGKMRRKQDLDLFARMINMGCYALNLNESLLLFRSNEDNYMRRKSWEYCKSYIEVEKENFKRGYCSLLDLIIVVMGQLLIFLLPKPLMKRLSDKVLRS